MVTGVRELHGNFTAMLIAKGTSTAVIYAFEVAHGHVAANWSTKGEKCVAISSRIRCHRRRSRFRLRRLRLRRRRRR